MGGENKSKIQYTSDQVIELINLCEENGELQTEGFFRISAPKYKIDEVEDYIHKENRTIANAVNEVQRKSNDPHLLPCLLKKSLRDLKPDFLLKEITNNLLEIASKDQLALRKMYNFGQEMHNEDVKINAIIVELNKLPQESQRIMHNLLTLCVKVSDNEKTNKMDARNISITLAPNLMTTGDMFSDLNNSNQYNLIFQTMIENKDTINARLNQNVRASVEDRSCSIKEIGSEIEGLCIDPNPTVRPPDFVKSDDRHPVGANPAVGNPEVVKSKDRPPIAAKPVAKRPWHDGLSIPVAGFLGGVAGGVGGFFAGAAIGSAVPVIGTLIGGVVGAVLGSAAGSTTAAGIAREVYNNDKAAQTPSQPTSHSKLIDNGAQNQRNALGQNMGSTAQIIVSAGGPEAIIRDDKTENEDKVRDTMGKSEHKIASHPSVGQAQSANSVDEPPYSPSLSAKGLA